MKIVTIKFKKGLTRNIKPSQKEYEYMCPIEDINIGDYVLLEVKIKKRRDFQVGRIESVIDLEEWDNENKSKLLPFGFVVCKIPVKNFEKRCADIRKIKDKTLINNEIRKKRQKKKS